jgi:hypothetical protein
MLPSLLGAAAQTDSEVMRVARQAPTSLTRRLVCELQTTGEEHGEEAFDTRCASVKELIRGCFVGKVEMVRVPRVW